MNRQRREGHQVCGATKEDGKLPTWPTRCRTGASANSKTRGTGDGQARRTLSARHDSSAASRGLSQRSRQRQKTQRPKHGRKEVAGTHAPGIVRAATGSACTGRTARGWLPSPDTEKRSGQGVPQKAGSEREHIRAAVVRNTRPKRLEGARGFTSARQHPPWRSRLRRAQAEGLRRASASPGFEGGRGPAGGRGSSSDRPRPREHSRQTEA